MTNNQSSNLEILPLALVFEQVVRSGSFGEAAKTLKLGKSTVSQRVATLERALDVRLLHRTTRSMTLTHAGQVLLDQLTPIMPQWQAALHQVRSHAETPQGHLVITAADALMSEYVVPAAVRFTQKFPLVQLRLLATTKNLGLVDEGIDIALRAGPLPDSGHGARTWWRGQHILVASPRLLTRFDAKRPTDLTDAPWLDIHGRRKVTHWYGDDGQTIPFLAEPSHITDCVSVFIKMLIEGVGFGVLPENLAIPFIKRGELVRGLSKWHAGDISFHVVTPSAGKRDSAVSYFIEELFRDDILAV